MNDGCIVSECDTMNDGQYKGNRFGFVCYFVVVVVVFAIVGGILCIYSCVYSQVPIATWSVGSLVGWSAVSRFVQITAATKNNKNNNNNNKEKKIYTPFHLFIYPSLSGICFQCLLLLPFLLYFFTILFLLLLLV